MAPLLYRAAGYASSIVAVARRAGLREGARFASFRAAENLGDWWWGIDTMGTLSPRDLGYTDPDFHEYGPASYELLRFCLDRLPVRAGESVFVDYGCGLGRAVVVAGGHPFKRVVGVEYSRDLGERARANIRRAARRLRCPVEIVIGDAREVPLPSDADLIFFNNPFFGSVLESVVESIRDSLRIRPRHLQIAYGNCAAFDELIQARGWRWIEKTLHRTFYQDFLFAIYSCHPS